MERKILGLLIMCFLLGCQMVEAMERPCRVAVMDFGIHKGASSSDITIENGETAATDYVVQRLVDSGSFKVMDKFLIEEKLAAEGLNTKGIIDPAKAQRIGQMLDVPYIIYGNVAGISTSDNGAQVSVGGVKTHAVKSRVIIRIMDVATGEILMAAKGEGKSQSAEVTAGTDEIGVISIGSTKVYQVSVHNSLEKAAYNAVDLLIERLFGEGKAPATSSL